MSGSEAPPQFLIRHQQFYPMLLLYRSVSESICLQCGRPGFNSWVGKIPWRRKWQPTPGESHGQRSLVGYSPCGHKSRPQLSDYTTTAYIHMYSQNTHSHILLRKWAKDTFFFLILYCVFKATKHTMQSGKKKCIY